MFTAIFVILMLFVFAEMLWFAAKLAWGIGKILFSLVFFPLLMICLAASGLILLAIPVLIIVGIVALIIYFLK